MIVNIREAKARFLERVERAEAGEEVIIARRTKPVIRLTPAPDWTPPNGEGDVGNSDPSGPQTNQSP